MNSVLTVHALYSYRREFFIVIFTAIKLAHDTVYSAQLCVMTNGWVQCIFWFCCSVGHSTVIMYFLVQTVIFLAVYNVGK